jgi:hypothetical protein
VGTVMALKVKSYYPDFYKEYGKLLWVSSCLLAFPLYIRAINTILMQTSKPYWTYYNAHFTFCNTTYVLLSSAFPLLLQLMSLMFGAASLKKKDEKTGSGRTIESSLNTDSFEIEQVRRRST